MKLIFILTAIVFSSTCFAQQDTALVETADTINSVIVHKDARVDLLVKKQAYINDITSRGSKRTDKGYRLMIISTNNREDALAAKTKVYTFFPELKAYMWYQSPYFRVKAGNFLERKDAEAFQKRFNTYFPKGVFIMKDIIEVKPAKNVASDDDIQP
jgi:hypothetical protein